MVSLDRRRAYHEGDNGVLGVSTYCIAKCLARAGGDKLLPTAIELAYGMPSDLHRLPDGKPTGCF